MFRIVLLSLFSLLLQGCVVVTGNTLGLLGSDRGLEEVVIDGDGAYKVALIDITGVITDAPTQGALGLVRNESTLARVDAALRQAAADDNVKAVVLRIDSPGGSVSASDALYARVQRFKSEQAMPVVAMLGGFATSGGYYAACAADRIVAMPSTVTGSIGVILVHINVEGLLHKFGIESRIYQAGEHKDLLSPLSKPTAEEQAMVQQILDSMHARFIEVVRENRPDLDETRLAALTDGRVFGAEQALRLGLVDDVGYLPDALQAAEVRAGIEDASVVRYLRPGETRDSIYSRAGDARPRAGSAAQGVLTAHPGHFMYLWPAGL